MLTKLAAIKSIEGLGRMEDIVKLQKVKEMRDKERGMGWVHR